MISVDNHIKKYIKITVDISIWSSYNNQVGRQESADTNGILAQLGEHLPYKQRVTGSSPVGPIQLNNMARWLNWLERPVHTREVESSSLSLATEI